MKESDVLPSNWFAATTFARGSSMVKMFREEGSPSTQRNG